MTYVTTMKVDSLELNADSTPGAQEISLIFVHFLKMVF